MDDPLRMCAGERRRQLARGPQDVIACRLTPGANFFPERVAIDELGGDVEIAVDLLERVDRADAGMRERGGRARLAPQALTLSRIADQMRRERLERDGPSQLPLGRQIHASHPAASQLADDRVLPDDGARRQRVVVQQEIRRTLGDRLRQKRARPRVVVDKRQHFVADDGVVGRFAGHPAADAGRVVIERLLEQFAHAPVLFGCHRTGPVSSRNSQARARANLRFNVAGDIRARQRLLRC